MARPPRCRTLPRAPGIAGTVLRCLGRCRKRSLVAVSRCTSVAGHRPEGALARPSERFRYRTGVYYMARDFDLPVVPVATNLGLFWRQTDFWKTPGTATVEFLDPIPTGMDRTPFLAHLESVIETRTQELIAMATGEAPVPSRLVPNPNDARRPDEQAAADPLPPPRSGGRGTAR